ncbi:MAG TPA: single-stranded DNA-binding protein [Chloroflexi bacterium]|nr:single-stranded DNA-binding protein [Chloroflexota bacterium]
MFHRIIIAGYLGRDPEMRYLPNGTPVTNFSVATNRRWTDQEGNQREETVWFRISVFGKQAEVCNQYLSKGRAVLVEGRLRPDESGNPRIFTRQDGTVGASYEVVALNVRFLGRAGEAAPLEEPEETPVVEEEEEIPF